MWFQVGWCGGEGGVSSEHTKPDEQGSIRCLCPSSGLGLCPSLSRCPSLGICPSLGLRLGLKLGLGLGLGLGSRFARSRLLSSRFGKFMMKFTELRSKQSKQRGETTA